MNIAGWHRFPAPSGGAALAARLVQRPAKVHDLSSRYGSSGVGRQLSVTTDHGLTRLRA